MNIADEQYVFDMLSRKTILEVRRINEARIAEFFTKATQLKLVGYVVSGEVGVN